MIRVKDLGSFTSIAHYISKDHPAGFILIPKDEVAGLCADLAEVVVAQVEARDG